MPSDGALPLAQNLIIAVLGQVQCRFCELHAQGTVCDLRRVSDLDGLYVAANANVAVGSGSGSQTMRNKHGVINLVSEQQGVKLTLGGQGVRIMLKDR